MGVICNCGSRNIIKSRLRWKTGKIENYGLCLDCGIAKKYDNLPEFADAKFYIKEEYTEQKRKEHKIIKKALFKRDGKKCNHCDAERRGLQIDHKMPKMFGGTDEMNNLQILCYSCNIKKSFNLVIL